MSKNKFSCDCTVVHEDVVREVRESLLPDRIYERSAAFFKIFGDTTRVRIIAAIDRHEMCVCDIATLLGMTKSAVSHQLALLRGADVVRSRRDGKTVYYSLSDDHVRAILESGLEHVQE